ncbi:unnamed protein product [marine sediment metagenome]|uniref:Uncharacterized protein n=1 Tax=marine sediment metagenome TaxID=412755 RepID=X1G313_9ZZZZ
MTFNTVSTILLVTYYLPRKDVNMILDEFVVGQGRTFPGAIIILMISSLL